MPFLESSSMTELLRSLREADDPITRHALVDELESVLDDVAERGAKAIEKIDQALGVDDGEDDED